MKTNKILAVAAAVVAFGGLAGSAQTVSTNYTFNVNQAIPDGSALGLASVTNLAIAGAGGGTITSLTVGLDITGGFNGDLYAYLVGPHGGYAVLLNRPGVTAGNSFGYSDTGFNVTFDDSVAHSVHFYQADGAAYNGNGQLINTWQPDGETIDPLSAPGLFPAAQIAMLNSFNGSNPNGTWTLFVADLSAGGQSTLVNWTLTLVATPEPSSVALLGVGLAGALLAVRRKAVAKA